MLPFRRHHPRVTEPPPWTLSPVCAEYHASGLELRLIDLVDERDRWLRVGRDVGSLDEEIADLQDELARVESGSAFAVSPAFPVSPVSPAA